MVIILFLLSKTQFYVPVVTLSARDNKKLSNFFLEKDLKGQFIGMSIK